MAEVHLQDLAGRRRHRHRHVHLAAKREAEVEVLAQQLRRERRGPVEVDQRRRLVGGEHRAHHAVVEEREEGVARHAHLVGQQRDLDQVLDHHAEHDVVRDLADAREFAVADIGDARRREHLDHLLDLAERRLGSGADRRQLAGLDHLGVAGDRRADVVGAAILQPLADGDQFLDRDGRAVDEHAGRLAVAAQHAVLAEIDLLDVLALGDDREHHVHAGEVGRLVDDLAARLGERLGLGAGAIPDRDVVAGLQQPLGHRVAHAAHADPADPLRVLCHSRCPPASRRHDAGFC